MNEKLFTYIKPYLDYIDAGKLYKQPFCILYRVIAVLMGLFPLYLLYAAIDMGIFSTGAKMIIAFILIWVVLAAAGCLSFQLWWDRSNKVQQTSSAGDDFTATPVGSHLIQTGGEWLGSYMAVVGFCVSLIGWIFLGSGMSIPGIPALNMGLMGLVYFPIAGFLTIVASRFVAELCRALVAIANNTRK